MFVEMCKIHGCVHKKEEMRSKSFQLALTKEGLFLGILLSPLTYTVFHPTIEILSNSWTDLIK